MSSLEKENSILKQQHNYLKSRISVILVKGNISRYIESTKMCLEGVEWSLDGNSWTDAGKSFWVRILLEGGYHLQSEGRKVRVRRIAGSLTGI